MEDRQIEEYLNRLSDSDDDDYTSKEDLSDVEDHIEIEEEVPTDSDDDEPLIRLQQQQHRSSCVIIPPGSEAEENVFEYTQRIIIPSARRLRGKNGHRWSSTSFESMNTRTQARNIVHIVQGPANNAKNVTEAIDCFSMFITADMIGNIVEYTNEEIVLRSSKYKEKTATISSTCKEELTALLGLLLLSATKKDNHLSSLELFDPTYSGTRYVSVMSRERFDFLLNCLFDNKSTRDERKAQDKFAPIRELWEVFIQKCRDSYKAGSYVTIDEQLLGFRGRCPFRMYIPSKPNKYGIKILMLCDVKTKYMLNAIPYTGKVETNGDSLGSYYVKTLSECLWGSNRNITMDNWFTSVPLAHELLKDPYKLTMVGTLRANKREIPSALLEIKQRPIGSTMFCYDKESTMVSYKPKINKNVLLLSTTHGKGTVAASGKPDMIEFYNSTKGAVDTFDQMCGNMSCSRKTQRWPLCYFYGMLNMAIINSNVVYVHNMVKKGSKPKSRRGFVKDVSAKMIEPWLRKRREIPTLRRCLKRKIGEILEESSATETPGPSSAQKKICGFCDYKKRRMTRFQCKDCKKFMCMDHRGLICVECAN